MRTSAVLATFNGRAFLREQLESMLQQSVGLDEIVVVDDCSTDDTLEIVADVQSTSSVAIEVLSTETNLGTTRNFERGLAAANGDVIFLADQDDVWHVDKVARMLDEFSHRPSLHVLFTDAALVDERGTPLRGTLLSALNVSEYERRLVRHGQAFDALLRRNLATGATMAIRRVAVERAFPFPVEWLHDEWIAIVASAWGQVDFIDEPLIDYRQHESNQIGAARLTIRGALGKMQQSRGAFHRNLARRASVLRDKLSTPELQVAFDRITMLDGKVRHAQRRSQLPCNHLARLPIVWRELVDGGYRQYANGWRSVVRDLLEPMRGS